MRRPRDLLSGVSAAVADNTVCCRVFEAKQRARSGGAQTKISAPEKPTPPPKQPAQTTAAAVQSDQLGTLSIGLL